jgi:tight adherence protein B
MTEAGNGQVISSDGDALAQTFASEADVLARQVLVTAQVPGGFDAEEATVEVRLPSSTTTLVASALARINDASAPTTSSPSIAVPDAEPAGWDAPPWVLYVAFGVLGLGAIGVAVLLVPGPPAPLTIADRVAAYSAATRGAPAAEDHQSVSEPMLDQAKAAAAGVLERHHGLNDRLTRRLTAAGSEFKPSEWLLVHIGVVLAAGLVGLLVGGGNILIGLLFLLPGAFAPPMYLSFKASRRRKQFDTALPEVLQLLSGALSAGLSLAQAVDTVSTEGPQPIASEFKRVLVEARLGVGIEDAFDAVAERFQSKDFAWVVMAIRIQRQVGGNLAELLTTVSETMRERQYLRRQVNALAAEGKLSALILAALPPMVFVFVMFTRGDYMRPLFSTGIGLMMLIGGTVWLAIGIFWMSRLVKVEI